MNRPQFIRGVAGLGAASALGGMTALPAWAQAKKPIVLGASLSLTGIYADGGKYCLEGYQLAIDQFNAKGGVLGRPLQLKYYDDQSDGATGIRLYERLIDEDKVDLIVGPYGTAITAPVTNVAEKYKMPMICPETADVAMFSRGFRYIFQALGPVQSYLYGVLSIAHDRGFKKLAVIGGDIAFAHSLANAVPTIARGFGQAIVIRSFIPATPAISRASSKKSGPPIRTCCWRCRFPTTRSACCANSRSPTTRRKCSTKRSARPTRSS